MTTLYGIPNCDSVKKAQQWLSAHNISYQFIDIKKTPLDTALLNQWLMQHDISTLINKRSTTWRNLSTEEQAQIHAHDSAIALLSAYPTLLKRPVLALHGRIIVGFTEQTYAQLLSA